MRSLACPTRARHLGAAARGRRYGVVVCEAPSPLTVKKRGSSQFERRSPSAAAPPPSKGPVDSLFDSIPDPILRAAVKEPIAFWGGVFAGMLRLDINQDPLRTWVDRTSEQAGVVKRQQ